MFLEIAAILFLFALYITINALLRTTTKLNTVSDIKTHGYIVEEKILNSSQVQRIQNQWDNKQYRDIYDSIRNNEDILKLIQKKIGNDYIIMDYVMYLSNSVLHTCHRDNNGSRFNELKGKSYTMILYIDDMKNCLDVVPYSHRHMGIYNKDSTHTFICEPGALIIFDADLVHSGSLGNTENNRRIQMKICHKDDVSNLKYYDNYHKIMDKQNTNSLFSKQVQKEFSCKYPVISDMTQGNNKSYISGKISNLEKLFSQIFYSNKDYYKLPNAF